MNIVAVLVVIVSVLFVPFACARIFDLVSQAKRVSGAGDTRQKEALVRDVLGLIGLTLWIGLAGFWAVTDRAAYDVARYARMSRQEQKRLEFGVLWTGAGFVCLTVYALSQRNARQRKQSDEAVARAIEEWNIEHNRGRGKNE